MVTASSDSLELSSLWKVPECTQSAPDTSASRLLRKKHSPNQSTQSLKGNCDSLNGVVVAVDEAYKFEVSVSTEPMPHQNYYELHPKLKYGRDLAYQLKYGGNHVKLGKSPQYILDPYVGYSNIGGKAEAGSKKGSNVYVTQNIHSFIRNNPNSPDGLYYDRNVIVAPTPGNLDFIPSKLQSSVTSTSNKSGSRSRSKSAEYEIELASLAGNPHSRHSSVSSGSSKGKKAYISASSVKPKHYTKPPSVVYNIQSLSKDNAVNNIKSHPCGSSMVRLTRSRSPKAVPCSRRSSRKTVVSGYMKPQNRKEGPSYNSHKNFAAGKLSRESYLSSHESSSEKLRRTVNQQCGVKPKPKVSRGQSPLSIVLLQNSSEKELKNTKYSASRSKQPSQKRFSSPKEKVASKSPPQLKTPQIPSTSSKGKRPCDVRNYFSGVRAARTSSISFKKPKSPTARAFTDEEMKELEAVLAREALSKHTTARHIPVSNPKPKISTPKVKTPVASRGNSRKSSKNLVPEIAVYKSELGPPEDLSKRSKSNHLRSKSETRQVRSRTPLKSTGSKLREHHKDPSPKRYKSMSSFTENETVRTPKSGSTHKKPSTKNKELSVQVFPAVQHGANTDPGSYFNYVCQGSGSGHLVYNTTEVQCSPPRGKHGENVIIQKCTDETCGKSNAVPCRVSYAHTIISRFHNYTIYEVLKSTPHKPRRLSKITEGVFVVRN